MLINVISAHKLHLRNHHRQCRRCLALQDDMVWGVCEGQCTAGTLADAIVLLYVYSTRGTLLAGVCNNVCSATAAGSCYSYK